MKPAHFITILVVIFVAWASLFLTTLNENNHLKSIISTLKSETTDSQNHVDCLFKLATTPHSTMSPPVIPDIKKCKINANGTAASTPTPPANIAQPLAVSSPPKIVLTPTPTTQSQPLSVSSPSSAAPATPASSTPPAMPVPAKPGLIRQVLNLLRL